MKDLIRIILIGAMLLGWFFANRASGTNQASNLTFHNVIVD